MNQWMSNSQQLQAPFSLQNNTFSLYEDVHAVQVAYRIMYFKINLNINIYVVLMPLSSRLCK